MEHSTPKQTARYIAQVTSLRPKLAIVLGSGFGAFARTLKVDAQISYAKLSGFLPTRVEGHDGELLIGTSGGVQVFLLNGRSHYYEGHSMAEVTFPIRVAAAFGVRSLLLTNAAGGINRRYRPEDFMLFSDHINFMGANPLRGNNSPDKYRFVDLTRVYDTGFASLLRRAARLARIRLHTGVYVAVSGPSFETPAEIKAFRLLGAEAVVARHLDLAVAAVSLIANPAADRTAKPISHESVLACAGTSEERICRWLSGFVSLYASSSG
jgi:purine-nucleoside phosphorylase